MDANNHGMELLFQIGRGTKSVKDACDTASRSRSMDCITRALADLAPRTTQERDLQTWVAGQPWRKILPDLYEFECVKSGTGEAYGVLQPSTHFCLLPHEVVGCLTEAGPELLQKVCGLPIEWDTFWRQRASAARAALAEGPLTEALIAAQAELQAATAVPDSPMECIPIGVHGDDAGVQVTEKITIVTWGAVAVPGPTWDSRLLFTAVKGAEADFGASVLDEAYRVLVWSLQCLHSGHYPEADHTGRRFGPDHHPRRAAMAGKPLGRGLRAKLVEVRGDWKFLRETLHLKQHYGCRRGRMCHLCQATRQDAPERFSDFSRGAPCRTLTTHAEWCAEQRAQRLGPTPFLEVPGFHVRMVHFDIMHTLDLGILQLALPAALHELLHAGFFGEGNVEERLKAATRHYKAWCKRGRVKAQAKRFRLAWVKLPHPQIGQVHAKAAAARSMQHWMCDVCEQRARAAPSEHAWTRWALFWNLCSADRLMRRGRRHLPRNEQERLAQRIEAALQSYGWLSGRARQSGVSLWKLIPKHHAMTHIGFDTLGVNPRHVQCYLDEDMVGKIKRLYVACHPKTAPRRCLERYVLGQAMHWLWALEHLRPQLKRPRPS